MKNLIIIIIAFTLFISLPSVLWANDLFNFNILIINALQEPTQENISIDPQLSNLQNELHSGFPTFSTFKLIGQKTLTTKIGNPAILTLPSPDSTLQLLPTSVSQTNTISIELSINNTMTTTVQAVPGTTFYQAGIPFNNGILVIAITVQ